MNLSLDFGDGQIYTQNNININNYLSFNISHNYTNGGSYKITLNASSPGINDYEAKNIKFGVRANNLTINLSNVSQITFEFDLYNDIVETAYNVSWNCSNGQNSSLFNMTGKTIATYYIQNNFTQPRLNVFSCTAKGIDGNETKTTNFTIDGLRIQDYDVLLNNISRRVISYNIKNNFNTLNSTHINMYDDGSDFFTDQSTDMTSQENILAFAEVNYSSDSAKGLNINVYSLPVAGDYYYDRFLYRGVQIRNYNRISTNYTTYVMLFDIYNNWYSGYVNWSIGEPNIVNSTYLNSNESLMIFIENNYSTQGYEQPEINATVSSYVERIKEFFEIRPIKILNLLTLTENLSNSVS